MKHPVHPAIPAFRIYGAVGKRLTDLLCAVGCFLLAFPFFVTLPLIIKLTSPGPVFYLQRRTGLRGRPFTMWKFRSMVVGAEREGRAVWASERDPRVTAVGAVMRRFRMDELPQLFNILRGDMSFVGPRPERPEFVEVLERFIPDYHRRHFVKPGLTGWAQVRFRYGASVEDSKTKFAYDLDYLREQSLALDCWIILKTVGVVVRGEARAAATPSRFKAKVMELLCMPKTFGTARYSNYAAPCRGGVARSRISATPYIGRMYGHD
jgi:lipopolysaccharide/colanic/teichoic acid biosynthesis glycosyltransferase